MPTVSRAALLRMACDPFCYLSAAFHLLMVISSGYSDSIMLLGLVAHQSDVFMPQRTERIQDSKDPVPYIS